MVPFGRAGTKTLAHTSPGWPAITRYTRVLPNTVGLTAGSAVPLKVGVKAGPPGVV